MKKILEFIINLIFPISCLNCHQGTTWLCQKCFDSIPINRQPFCPICHAPNNCWRLCPKCQKNYQLDGVIIASDFKNPLLRQIIHCYKYQYVKSLSQILSRIIVNFFAKADLPYEFILTSLPLHRKREKMRCFNQAEEIAKELAEEFKMAFDPDLLKRIKNTKPQARLNKIKRTQNIKDAFRLERGCYGQKVIIVDDVFTTGATLNECAKLLKEAGAKEVWGLVIAKG